MLYPETRIDDVVDEIFGMRIADPYRWLEGDLRKHPEVADWASDQNALAFDYLSRLPGRDRFRARLRELFDHAWLTTPEKRAGDYYFARNPGLDEQPTLLVRDGGTGRDRVLLDPANSAGDDAPVLAEWSVSGDGRHLAYATQRGGSDWRTIRILDVGSGKLLDDVIAWARFTGIAWSRDGLGFFYSRFPAPPEEQEFEAQVTDHGVYYHAIGTPQTADRLVHATSKGRLVVESIAVSADGRYGILSSTPGAGGNALSVVDFQDASWRPTVLVEDAAHRWTFVGNTGSKLLLATNREAERGKIVVVDLADDHPRFVDLIMEQASDTLSEAALLGGHILTSYIVDGRSEVRLFALDGSPAGIVDLPGIGTAGDFRGRPDDPETFFVFTGHNEPTTIYRFDIAERTLTPWAAPGVAIDLDHIVVEQRFCASKDGTSIPMFVVTRADRTGPAPTILYGYGGFGISLTPYYSPAILAWVEAGGAYAIANLRGGGEYGKRWHDAGRGKYKQNGFDDFIAAAEYLKRERIAAADGLAIQGESNGGLLVGAVVNQRPDLFAAALPGVGVMDMLRFDRFTGGQFLIEEYGDPCVEADFVVLRSYSPYHNVQAGVDYPAILVTTADTDDRVVPAQSFKYVAALQAADLGDRPRIIRVERGAGHGAGKSMGKAIEETADLWAFAAHWTKLIVEPYTKAGS